MKDVLSFLVEVTPDILEKNLSDRELVEIHNSSTDEEVEEYEKNIELFLEEKAVPTSDLRMAVSYFYLRCHLLESKLI